MSTPKRRHYKGCIAFKPPRTLSYVGEPNTREQLYEISQQQLQVMFEKMKGLPLCTEHNDSAIGTVTRAYFDVEGSAMVDFELFDNEIGASAAELIGQNIMRGLSLKHNRLTNEPLEVSLCYQGARPNTWIVEASSLNSAKKLPRVYIPTEDARILATNAMATTPNTVQAAVSSTPKMDVLREVPVDLNKMPLAAPTGTPQAPLYPTLYGNPFALYNPLQAPVPTAPMDLQQQNQMMQLAQLQALQAYQKQMQAFGMPAATPPQTPTAPVAVEAASAARDARGRFTKGEEAEAGKPATMDISTPAESSTAPPTADAEHGDADIINELASTEGPLQKKQKLALVQHAASQEGEIRRLREQLSKEAKEKSAAQDMVKGQHKLFLSSVLPFLQRFAPQRVTSQQATELEASMETKDMDRFMLQFAPIMVEASGNAMKDRNDLDVMMGAAKDPEVTQRLQLYQQLRRQNYGIGTATPVVTVAASGTTLPPLPPSQPTPMNFASSKQLGWQNAPEPVPLSQRMWDLLNTNHGAGMTPMRIAQ